MVGCGVNSEVQDMDKWLAVVNKVMNLLGNF
jgi:hypothetical protein